MEETEDLAGGGQGAHEPRRQKTWQEADKGLRAHDFFKTRLVRGLTGGSGAQETEDLAGAEGAVDVSPGDRGGQGADMRSKDRRPGKGRTGGYGHSGHEPRRQKTWH